MGIEGPEVDCGCDHQTLRLVDTVWYSVCDNCGRCFNEDGDYVGFEDEIRQHGHPEPDIKGD